MPRLNPRRSCGSSKKEKEKDKGTAKWKGKGKEKGKWKGKVNGKGTCAPETVFPLPNFTALGTLSALLPDLRKPYPSDPAHRHPSQPIPAHPQQIYLSKPGPTRFWEVKTGFWEVNLKIFTSQNMRIYLSKHAGLPLKTWFYLSKYGFTSRFLFLPLKI